MTELGFVKGRKDQNPPEDKKEKRQPEKKKEIVQYVSFNQGQT